MASVARSIRPKQARSYGGLPELRIAHLAGDFSHFRSQALKSRSNNRQLAGVPEWRARWNTAPVPLLAGHGTCRFVDMKSRRIGGTATDCVRQRSTRIFCNRRCLPSVTPAAGTASAESRHIKTTDDDRCAPILTRGVRHMHHLINRTKRRNSTKQPNYEIPLSRRAIRMTRSTGKITLYRLSDERIPDYGSSMLKTTGCEPSWQSDCPLAHQLFGRSGFTAS
jgi:hypothetical protein